jgi:hypothetical protein
MPGLREKRPWAAARAGWYGVLERAPRAYCAYLRHRSAHTVVTGDSAIVLEGFPGSANSFAREAVLYSNPGVAVASHIHSPAHVLEALRLGRPTVLTIRPPVDAIASFLSRGYASEITAAFRSYERMHRRLLPVLDRLVVAPFDRVTDRFGDVVDEVNARFGTTLVPFPHDDPDARDAVFATLAAYTHAVAPESSTLLQATPTAARRERSADVRAALLDPAHAELRRRGEGLYAECLDHSASAAGRTR